MAKDLPYFKFYCSEWNDGDITLEDFNIQGLFINVCSYYWSNECNVNVDKLYKKFKHNSHDVDYLIDEGFVKLTDGFVNINFLDEQLNERESRSKKNSEAGKKSAEARRLKKLDQQQPNENSTGVKITFNESSTKSQPLRGEERREEKKREDINTALPFSFYNSLLSHGASKELASEWIKVRKTKKATNSKTALDNFIKQQKKTNASLDKVLELCVINSWSGFNSDWYKEPNKEPRTKQQIYEEGLKANPYFEKLKQQNQ